MEQSAFFDSSLEQMLQQVASSAVNIQVNDDV